MSQLDLAQLECFADVVELGGFTAAAERRGVTQPAVSMQVRALERRLGVRLVERVGRTAMPTRAGIELLHHARIIRGDVSRAIAAVAPHKTKEVGRVRVGTGATACIYLLPPLLRRLRARHPGIEITVQTGNAAEIAQRVGEGTLDAGLVTLPIRSRALDVTEVYVEQLVAVLPVPPDGATGLITPSALAASPLVLYESGGGTRRLIDDWFKAANVAARPTMELGSVEAIKEMVGAGLGASVIPSLAVRKTATKFVTGTLDPPLSRTLGLIVRRDRVVDWTLREFIQCTRQLRNH